MLWDLDSEDREGLKGSKRRRLETTVPELGVGLVGEVVITGCVVVLGTGRVGVGVDGPSTRQS